MEELINLINSIDKTFVFIDSSWVLYKSAFVFPEDRFKTSKGIPNGHLFGLANLLITLDRLGYEAIICEDGKIDSRQKLNEDYKANRNSKNFWREFPKIRVLTNYLSNTYCVYGDNLEADDLMFIGAKLCSERNKKCFIHSGDNDLLQALDNNISVCRKFTLDGPQEIITSESEYYTNKYPVSPEKLPYYRAFKGDVSDNLKAPVARLPKDLIIDLVDYLYENDNLSNYRIKKKSHEKWIAKLVENWDIYLSNYRIMKLTKKPFTLVKKNDRDNSINLAQELELFKYMTYLENNS